MGNIGRRRMVASSALLVAGLPLACLAGEKRSKNSSGSNLVHPLSLFKVDVGAAGTVLWNPGDKTVIKSFRTNGTCVNGRQPPAEFNSDSKMTDLYSAEKRVYQTLISLNSQHIPRIYGFDDRRREIRMEYCGEDCLTHFFWTVEEEKHKTRHRIESLTKMLNEYKSIGIFKMNIALSNLFETDGRLVAIDFKESTPRTRATLNKQVERLYQHISKWVGIKGVRELASTFDDFSPELVENTFAQQEKKFAKAFPKQYSIYRGKFG